MRPLVRRSIRFYLHLAGYVGLQMMMDFIPVSNPLSIVLNFEAAMKSSMTFRIATLADSELLAKLNHQLIQDEGHRNRMTVPELEQRLRGWLSGEYRAVIFEEGEVVAYALFREQPQEIYLRQLLVVRTRRRQGIGRNAVETLRAKLWPRNKRLTVDVLVANPDAIAFWRAIGYTDYCLTLEIRPQPHRT